MQAKISEYQEGINESGYSPTPVFRFAQLMLEYPHGSRVLVRHSLADPFGLSLVEKKVGPLLKRRML